MDSDRGSLLLTGATGLIGGALLARLLEETGLPIFCVVRSSARSGPLERLRQRLGEIVDAHRHRLHALGGDVTRPLLGLAAADRERVLSNVHVVLHCAAQTSFVKHEECRATNILGLQHLLELLRGAARKPLLVYYGSAAASGAHSDAVLTEEGYVDAAGPHHVEYTRTKAFAEELLATERACEVVILRPSMVIPDVHITPRTARESIWPVVLMGECRAVPVRGGAQFDAVPRSYVVDYTLRIAFGARRHSVYHLTAGPALAPTWCGILAAARPQGPATALLDPQTPEWRRARAGLSRREIFYVRRLRHYLPFMNQNVTFDCARLHREFGPPPAAQMDVRRYLPPLLARVSLEQAVAQSDQE
jgi:dTDP-4-dehydrorhamnose reductase